MPELLDGINLGELRGRRQKSISAIAVRPLQEADLAMLAQGDRARTPVVTIKRLRDRHHAIARLIAAGKTNGEVSMVTGMDPARISTLRSDPSFKELVADYQKVEAGLSAEFHERLHMLGLTAVEELQERLETSDEPIPMTTLLEVAKFSSDRIGHGPMTRNLNTNVDIQLSSRLASARKRIPERSEIPNLPAVIEAEFTEVTEE